MIDPRIRKTLVASTALVLSLSGIVLSARGDEPPKHKPSKPFTLQVEQAEKEVGTPIEDCIKEGAITMELTGDGVATAKCTLSLTNPTDKVQKVQIPEFQCFIPDDSTYQVMMKVGDPVIPINPGYTINLDIETVCASAKSVKPPPAGGVHYIAGLYPDREVGDILKRIVQSSQEFERKGMYSNVPISPQKRANKIAQMTIWHFLGKVSGRTEDAVTEDTIREDLLKSMGQDGLSDSEKQSLDSFVDETYKAIDRTLKNSRMPVEPKQKASGGSPVVAPLRAG